MAAATESTQKTVAAALSRKTRISSRHSLSSSTTRTRAPARPERDPEARPSRAAAERAGVFVFVFVVEGGGRTSAGGFFMGAPGAETGEGAIALRRLSRIRAEGVGARNGVATVTPRHCARERGQDRTGGVCPPPVRAVSAGPPGRGC